MEFSGHNNHRAHPMFSTHFHTSGHLFWPAEQHTLLFHMHNLSIVDSRPQRRSAVRFRLSLPVIFHWTANGEFTEGGFTHDIALDGALICSTRCPPIGCAVRIEVLIPCPDQSSEPLRIQCAGTVTRIVSEGDQTRFGVRGSFSDDNIVSQISPSAQRD
jgi:hypothetical protein